MKTNLLGRTGLQISEIAFGGGVTGGILIAADEPTRQAALARAVVGGINWIDTAALYGDGASEETIGRHLASLKPPPHASTNVRLARAQPLAGGRRISPVSSRFAGAVTWACSTSGSSPAARWRACNVPSGSRC